MKSHKLSQIFNTFAELKTMATYGKDRRHGLLQDAFTCAQEYRDYRHVKRAIRAQAPVGDGHPVLVLPGFTSNDASTAPLRHMLKKKGYKPYKWKGGVNLGLKQKTATHLAHRLKEIYEQNGRQKVSLVGHSLGGIYARVLAQEYPDLVRDVITVDTPFGVGMDRASTTPFVVNTIIRLSDPQFSLDNPGIAERMLTPPEEPTTSIFSKSDTVAGWTACLNPDTPHTENIEVHASHIGSIWHQETVATILERLAEPEGRWKPSSHAAHEKTPANPNWKPAGNDWRLFRL